MNAKVYAVTLVSVSYETLEDLIHVTFHIYANTQITGLVCPANAMAACLVFVISGMVDATFSASTLGMSPSRLLKRSQTQSVHVWNNAFVSSGRTTVERMQDEEEQVEDVETAPDPVPSEARHPWRRWSR